jgi:hypothetical protein
MAIDAAPGQGLNSSRPETNNINASPNQVPPGVEGGGATNVDGAASGNGKASMSLEEIAASQGEKEVGVPPKEIPVVITTEAQKRMLNEQGGGTAAAENRANQSAADNPANPANPETLKDPDIPDEILMFEELRARFGTMTKEEQAFLTKLNNQKANFTEVDGKNMPKKVGILELLLAKFRKTMYYPQLLAIWANPKSYLAQQYRSVSETVNRSKWFTDVKEFNNKFKTRIASVATKVKDSIPPANSGGLPVPA